MPPFFYTITKEKNKSPKILIIFTFCFFGFFFFVCFCFSWTKCSFSSKFIDLWKFLDKISQMKDWGFQKKDGSLKGYKECSKQKNDGKMVSVTDYFIILRLTHPSSLPTPSYTIFKIKKKA